MFTPDIWEPRGPGAMNFDISISNAQASKMELFTKIINWHFFKKIHLMFDTCLTGF